MGVYKTFVIKSFVIKSPGFVGKNTAGDVSTSSQKYVCKKYLLPTKQTNMEPPPTSRYENYKNVIWTWYVRFGWNVSLVCSLRYVQMWTQFSVLVRESVLM